MKNSHTKTAYCFLANSESRDFYLLIGLIYFLETYKNYHVQFEFIWDAHKIHQKKPDLVILPNTRGELIYYEIADYCYQNDILVFCHDSEGNFRTDIDFDYWGLNQKKQLYCPKIFTWNKRTTKYIQAKYNFSDELIGLTGNPGIDKYKYLQKANRNTILSKYQKSHYKYVVGYAGWAFGKIHNTEIDELIGNLGKPKEEGINWIIEERDIVKNILQSAIEEYPEVLFILKKHPRENFDSNLKEAPNEMNQLLNYPNVIYLKNEENIQDLIAISDIWTAFESTSIMESWLVDIPTIIIKNDDQFDPVNIQKGSYSVKNSASFLAALKKVLFEGERSFIEPETILTNRKEIIADAFGFDDGLNHLRCYSYFKPFLISAQRTDKRAKLNWSFLKKYLLLHIGKLFYIPSLFKKVPKLKKTVWVFENYKLKKIHEAKKDVYRDLTIFYEKEGIHKSIISEEIWKNI